MHFRYLLLYCFRNMFIEFKFGQGEHLVFYKPVRHYYIQKRVNKFEEIGSVNNRKRDHPRLFTEWYNSYWGSWRFCCESFYVSTSQWPAATFCLVIQFETLRKPNKFYPYKIQIIPELADDDSEGWIKNYSHKNNKQATVFLKRKIVVTGGYENAHVFREVHTQYPPKINVRADILGNNFISRC